MKNHRPVTQILTISVKIVCHSLFDVPANQYKGVLNVPRNPAKKHFHPDGNDDNRNTRPY